MFQQVESHLKDTLLETNHLLRKIHPSYPRFIEFKKKLMKEQMETEAENNTEHTEYGDDWYLGRFEDKPIEIKPKTMFYRFYNRYSCASHYASSHGFGFSATAAAKAIPIALAGICQVIYLHYIIFTVNIFCSIRN